MISDRDFYLGRPHILLQPSVMPPRKQSCKGDAARYSCFPLNLFKRTKLCFCFLIIYVRVFFFGQVKPFTMSPIYFSPTMYGTRGTMHVHITFLVSLHLLPCFSIKICSLVATNTSWALCVAMLHLWPRHLRARPRFGSVWSGKFSGCSWRAKIPSFHL
jgi:hypothetical protein